MHFLTWRVSASIQPNILNAVIEALGVLASTGAFEPARDALQDIGQHLIQSEAAPSWVGDYDHRAPADGFSLLPDTLDGLGGEESADEAAWTAKVCAYDVLVGAMPGERSEREQRDFHWRISSQTREAAKAGVESAGRFALHTGQYIEKLGPALSEDEARSIATILADPPGSLENANQGVRMQAPWRRLA